MIDKRRFVVIDTGPLLQLGMTQGRLKSWWKKEVKTRVFSVNGTGLS